MKNKKCGLKCSVVAILILSLIVLLLLIIVQPPFLECFGYIIDKKIDISTLLTSAISITAGLGGAVFLVVNYRRQSLDEEKFNVKTERDLISDFNSYATDLSAGVAQTVAALNGLAFTTDKLFRLTNNDTYKQRCVDIICAFIRSQQSEAEPELAGIKQGEAFRIIKQHVQDSKEESSSSTCTFNLAEAKIFSPLRLENCIFNGKVIFWGAEFLRSIYATNATFTDVNFNGTSFKGKRSLFSEAKFHKVSFQRDCLFANGVDFSKATFFQGVKFGYDSDPSPNAVSYPGKTIFGGPVSFDSADFNGNNLSFKGAEFYKEATFTDMKNVASIELPETKFAESVWFDRTEISRSINLDKAHINKDLYLRDLELDPIDFYGPEFCFYKLTVGESVLLDGTPVKKLEDHNLLKISRTTICELIPEGILSQYLADGRIKMKPTEPWIPQPLS
ncbi:pentapeptide repeat-containing protein [Arcanobacterium phocae]|uniref:pentapeptide repeat-containing protein n=1 Tax=Arcanobacterium phocae TaxID=131112 RepID=UPI001C0EC4BB|nr:pentapeptide repeat-containing protein [Arcanobacterium phocae]